MYDAVTVAPCVDDAVRPEPDGMASFTSEPPVDLQRPRPVRQASPASPASVASPPSLLLGRRGEFSSHSRPLPPFGFHYNASPLKKACHTSTGQHLHLNCPALVKAAAAAVTAAKKSRTKSVTFQMDARLKSDAMKLAVVFEMDQEDNISRV